MSQLCDGTVTFTITAFPRPATRPAKQDRPGRTARHQITDRQLRPGQLTAPPLIAAPVLLTPAELPHHSPPVLEATDQALDGRFRPGTNPAAQP